MMCFLQVKTPYERHYLLLCLTSTTLVHTRSLCDSEFEQCDSEIDRVKNYSTPKVLKFIDMLRQFKPAGEKPKVEEEKSPEVEAQSVPFKKGKGKIKRLTQKAQTDDTLCALIFVHNRYKAKSLFALLCVSYLSRL